ncbi:MAG: 2TM domain-containing protein [Flavobacterium sp.]
MRRLEKDFMFEKLQKETGISSEEYYIAYKKVKRIKRFYIHLTVYLLVNLYLILNMRFDSDSNDLFYRWNTYSTAFFWGIGLIAHGLSVFGSRVLFGDNWEENKIKEFIQKKDNRN